MAFDEAVGSDEAILTIPYDEDKVRDLAFKVSQWASSWDDFVWFFAESELRLQNSYVSEQDSLRGPHPEGIKLFPGKIVEQPDPEAIKTLAEEISQKNPRLEELHWFLAERKYLYNKILGVEE